MVRFSSMSGANPNFSLSIYDRAVREAKAELQTVKADFERLAKRKAVLEAFILNAEPLLPEGKNEPRLQFPVPSATAPPASDDPPIWKAITLAINGKASGFTVIDALQALERIGRPVTSTNKFQIVRAVLVRKTDVFRKISAGRYAVIGQEEHKEVPAA
jgi:hypothetical protein